MSHEQCITDLLGIQGWEVVQDGIEIEKNAVFVRIQRKAGTPFEFAKCGTRYLFCHEKSRPQVVRDFPIWGRKCYLIFGEVRVACDHCGVHVERLSWIDPHQRQTLHYEKYEARLYEILPVLYVASWEGLDKNTVYRVLSARVRRPKYFSSNWYCAGPRISGNGLSRLRSSGLESSRASSFRERSGGPGSSPEEPSGSRTD